MDQMIFRQVLPEDLEALFTLSHKTHIGLTSLPKNKELLEEYLQGCEKSFSLQVKDPGALYWFVLEDTEKNTFLGISGIRTQIEKGKSVYTFCMEEEIIPSLPSRRLLIPHDDVWEASELCSLYLIHEARKKGLAELLSWSRYLFLFLHRRLFFDVLVARYRGYFTDEGVNPFWEHVGKVFSGYEYDLFLQEGLQNPALFRKIMPKFPLYLDLLSPNAIKVCEQVHPNTKAAVFMAEKLGFTFTKHIDLFDAGPIFSAKTSSINLLSQISTHTPKISEDPPHTLLVVVRQTPFVVVQSRGEIANGHIFLPKAILDKWNLKSDQLLTSVRIR